MAVFSFSTVSNLFRATWPQFLPKHYRPSNTIDLVEAINLVQVSLTTDVTVTSYASLQFFNCFLIVWSYVAAGFFSYQHILDRLER